jgi:hypothetical protein
MSSITYLLKAVTKLEIELDKFLSKNAKDIDTLQHKLAHYQHDQEVAKSLSSNIKRLSDAH